MKLTEDDAKFLTTNQQIWRFDPGGKSRRASMVLESRSEVSFDDVLKLFNELKSDIKGIEKSLGDSLRSCHDEIKEINKKLEAKTIEISSWIKVVDDLRNENITLKKQVTELEVRV